MQILTVEDILNGKQPDLPPNIQTFKQAGKVADENKDQGTLGFSIIGRKSSEIMTISEEDIRIAFNILAKDIFTAEINLGLHRKLRHLISVHPYVELRSRHHWALVNDSLMQVAVLAVCRIYDGDSRTNGIPAILKRMSKDPARVSDELRADIASVSAKDETVKRLKIWRNEVFAHTNFDRASGAVVPKQENKLLLDDINILIERSVEVFNKHSGTSMSRNVTEAFIPYENTEYIFTTLQQERETWRGEVIAQYGLDPYTLPSGSH